MKYNIIEHKFVELIPNVIDEGTLYISTQYATATHRCFCGCGEIVVTPITPVDWALRWNGKTVTIDPSIGSWSLPCSSHYFIIENKVVWSRKWSDKEIKKCREKDKKIKSQQYSKFRKLFRRT